MLETELTMIRHGVTDWNQEQRFQGQYDIPLNETGKSQVQKLASFLKERQFSVCLSSDLKRARQTAQIICRWGPGNLKIEEKGKLREMDFGSWEGLTYEKIKEQTPDKLKNWHQNPVENSPPGGETLLQLQSRVKKCLQKIRREYEGNSILVITHGGVIKVYLTTILGLSPENYWQFNVVPGSVSIIKHYGKKAIINKLNWCPV